MQPQRFQVLDSFRGVAAISVMIFHIHAVSGVSEWSFFRNSAVFVEFFFLLSGFVIAHAYGERLADYSSIKKYMVSRIRRIFPLHIFMLMVFIILELGKLFADRALGFDFNGQPFSGSTALRELLPNMLLLQSWLPNFDMLSFNSPAWSISVEFYLYLLFAVLVVQLGFSTSLQLALFFVFYLSPIVLSELPRGVVHGAACFFCGAALRRIFSKVSPVLERFLINSSKATLIEFLVLLLGCFAVAEWGSGLVCVLVFALVILVFSVEAGCCSQVLKMRSLRSIGEWSYSIYLTHSAVIFVILSLLMVGGKIVGADLLVMLDGKRSVDLGYWGNTAYVMLVVVITVAFSWVTYHGVERRFMMKR